MQNNKRINVEEVFKNDEGKFFGMSSGHAYEKSEVEKIDCCYWTKPNQGADSLVLETE